MSIIIDTLIYDRTHADVARVFTLKNKILIEGISALSPDELTEYMGGMKGAYNYTDMNRVGLAVTYIAKRMIALPMELEAYCEEREVADDPAYHVPYDADSIVVTAKTNWIERDIPDPSDVAAYLADLSTLRRQIPLPADAPAVPTSLNNLTFSVANDIEYLLYVIYQAFLKVEAALYSKIDRTVPFAHAGIAYSGE